MAATPRKFAEKIAMHNQKGAEEEEEFRKIMAECASVKVPVGPGVPGATTMTTPMQTMQSVRIQESDIPSIVGPMSNEHGSVFMEPSGAHSMQNQMTVQCLRTNPMTILDTNKHNHRGSLRDHQIEEMMDPSCILLAVGTS